MSVNLELAAAARWVRAAVDQLPEEHRPDVGEDWSELMDTVEASRSEGAAILAIVDWRAEMQRRLGTWGPPEEEACVGTGEGGLSNNVRNTNSPPSEVLR